MSGTSRGWHESYAHGKTAAGMCSRAMGLVPIIHASRTRCTPFGAQVIPACPRTAARSHPACDGAGQLAENGIRSTLAAM